MFLPDRLDLSGPPFVLLAISFAMTNAAVLMLATRGWAALRPATLALAIVVSIVWPLSGVPLPAALVAVLAIGLALGHDRRIPGGRRITGWPAPAALLVVAAMFAIVGAAEGKSPAVDPDDAALSMLADGGSDAAPEATAEAKPRKPAAADENANAGEREPAEADDATAAAPSASAEADETTAAAPHIGRGRRDDPAAPSTSAEADDATAAAPKASSEAAPTGPADAAPANPPTRHQARTSPRARRRPRASSAPTTGTSTRSASTPRGPRSHPPCRPSSARSRAGRPATQ